MRPSQKVRPTAVIPLLLGMLVIFASVTRLHGRPAFLVGVAAGILVVLGIFLLVRKQS